MIIAVDAAVLAVTDERLKVGVYNLDLSLLQHLTKSDASNIYRFYSFSPIPQKVLAEFGPNVQDIVLKPEIGWLTLRLSLELLLSKADIFLGLGQALPFFHPNKSIIFVYDLAFELYPQYYPRAYKKLSWQTKFAVKHAKTIVAISNTTKKDLVKLYNVDPRKIKVIFPGVRINFTTDAFTSGESWLASPLQPATPEVDKPYFLYVGSYKPVKNIPNIIKAFGLFIQKIQKPYQLILAGSDYWMDKEILKTIKELKLDKLVKLVGFVNEEDLTKLYKNATAFISPSYYEGFGIPILEAMSFGIPVIASDRGSIPEVTANATLLVDPDDIESLAKAIKKIVTDEKLRKQMIEKGLIQARKFTWKKSAAELLRMINNL